MASPISLLGARAATLSVGIGKTFNYPYEKGPQLCCGKHGRHRRSQEGIALSDSSLSLQNSSSGFCTCRESLRRGHISPKKEDFKQSTHTVFILGGSPLQKVK